MRARKPEKEVGEGAVGVEVEAARAAVAGAVVVEKGVAEVPEEEEEEGGAASVEVDVVLMATENPQGRRNSTWAGIGRTIL